MRRPALLVALWLLGAAGLWWLLPPVPRHDWALPPGAEHVLVSADGVAVVTGKLAGLGSSPSAYHGPVEGWDVATNQRLWTEFGPDDRVVVSLTAGDRRVWCSRSAEPPVVRVASTGERVPDDDWLIDGRRVAFRAAGSGVTLAIARPGADAIEPPERFDLYHEPTGRRIGSIPRAGKSDRFAITADGRRAVLNVFDPLELHLYDLTTAELLARQPQRPDDLLESALAGGESVLVGDTVRSIRTGRTLLTLPPDASLGHDVFLPADDRWVVIRHDTPAGARLEWYDAATGQEDECRRLSLGGGGNTAAWVGVGNPKASDAPAGDFWRGGRWLWCQTRDIRPAGPTRRTLARLPGLADLADDIDRSCCQLVDASSGRVVVSLPGEWDKFLRVTTEGRLYTFTYGLERVQVWDTPLRPSPRVFAALAAGWTVVLAGICRWTGRRQQPVTALSRS